MPRALVTGASGFIGRHLARELSREGMDVSGVALAPRPSDWKGDWFDADLTNAEGTREILRAVRPDCVFHLAALIKGDSLSALLAVNVLATESLLRAVESECGAARVLVAGTSAEYGIAPATELPIRETNPLRPLNPYGVSKVAQSFLAAQYAMAHGLHVVRFRTFNVTGPGEPEALVCSAFAKQIAEIRAGRKPPCMEVGKLDSRRDFVDVRDAVRAYRLLADRGASGEIYNVCSGQSVAISQVLDILIRLAGVAIEIRQRPGAHLTNEVPEQVGDFGKCRSQTSWTPSLPLERSLRDLLSEWEGRIAAGVA